MNLTNFTSFKIGKNDSNRRVDRVLRKTLKSIPLSKIYQVLRKGRVRVNGKKIRNNYILKCGDKLQLHNSLLLNEPNLLSVQNNTTSLINGGQASSIISNNHSAKTVTNVLTSESILYRDGDFLILNKKRFSLVHGRGSLDEKVKAEYAKIQSKLQPSLSFVPGPLHRLDAGTSGILVFSQSLEAAQVFSKNLREGKIQRFYLALVLGEVAKTRVFNTPIAGKPACTKMKRLRYFPQKNISLVKVQILTGRKHQIRIHFAKNGFPLLGDKQFAKVAQNYSGYFLHFYKLHFDEKILNLPETITSPLPKYFLNEIK